jgi:hypothetical protein
MLRSLLVAIPLVVAQRAAAQRDVVPREIDDRRAVLARIRAVCDPLASVVDADGVARTLTKHLDDTSAVLTAGPSTWIAVACKPGRKYADYLLVPKDEIYRPSTSSQSRTANPATVDARLASHDAMSILSEALELHPDNAAVAELLANIALEAAHDPVARRGEPLARFAAQLYRAIEAGVDRPVVYRACVTLAMIFDERTEAHECSTRGLAAGRDSTWHLLRLASLAFERVDTATGLAELRLAASAAHDSAAQEELAFHGPGSPS